MMKFNTIVDSKCLHKLKTNSATGKVGVWISVVQAFGIQDCDGREMCIRDSVSTIGASAPTDPPKPIVMALAIVDDQILCRLIRPGRREIAYRILVTP